MSSEVFRRCDEKTFGQTIFCNIDRTSCTPTPNLWGHQVLLQLNASTSEKEYLDFVETNLRQTKVPNGIFTTLQRDYDAYTTDFAVLNVYFKSPTALQFKTTVSQTWLIYFSSIGGLLGLCIGLSIVTVAELIWICIRITADKLTSLNFSISKSLTNPDNNNIEL